VASELKKGIPGPRVFWSGLEAVTFLTLIQATSLQTGLRVLLSLHLVFGLPQLASETDGPVRRVRVTWGLFILLRWDTYPAASCPAAVLYREHGCPLRRRYFTLLVGQQRGPFFAQTALCPPCKKGSGLWGISALSSAGFTAYPFL